MRPTSGLRKRVPVICLFPPRACVLVSSLGACAETAASSIGVCGYEWATFNMQKAPLRSDGGTRRPAPPRRERGHEGAARRARRNQRSLFVNYSDIIYKVWSMNC